MTHRVTDFLKIGWVIPQKTKPKGPSLRGSEFIFWYLTRFAISEKVSHLRYKLAVSKPLFSTSRLELNTKNESERPVQSETKIQVIYAHGTQSNRFSEDQVGDTTKNKTKGPQFTGQ